MAMQRNCVHMPIFKGLLPVLVLAGLTPSVLAAARDSKELQWGPCRLERLAKQGFDCSTLQRPLRHLNPDGPQVDLAVFRLPATGPADQKIGTLFFNPGGPGQSGHGSSWKGLLLPDAIRRSFDFITWDPRGIGQSSPALENCSVGMPQRPAIGRVTWDQVLMTRQQQLAEANRDCIVRHRELIQGMGTVETVHDLEALRASVGDTTLTFWGVSYGTVIGSTYAALFPNRVRALVLDGNVSPWLGLEGLSHSSLAPDDSLRFFLQANPDLAYKFDRALKSLERQSLRLPDGSVYTRWDFLDRLIQFLPISRLAGSYGRTLIVTVDQALFSSGAQRAEALADLQQAVFRSEPLDGNAAAGFAAVVCQDFPQRPEMQSQRRGLSELTRRAPVYGGSLAVNFLAICSGYEELPASASIPRAPFNGLNVSGLITGSSWDGATPWQWSTEMARAFPSMRTLQVVGNEHGIYLNAQSNCVESAVTDYLLTARVPEQDQVCAFDPAKDLQAVP